MEDIKDRFTKARVKLLKENPFFFHLCMNLEFIEDNEGKEVDSCGVDCKGKLYYNPKWISKLSDGCMKTLLSHEILHPALFHLERCGGKNKKVWNIAGDIIINNLLSLNGFEFSGELNNGYVPRGNKMVIPKINLTIDDIDKKSCDEIYHILLKYVNELDNNGFDKHIYTDGGEPQEQENTEKEWQKKLSEALVFSQSKGKEPGGMNRYADAVLNNKLNWKQILYRYITNEIPKDYSYSRPSKRYYSTGIYFPRISKENINIAVAVDTSRSINKEVLTEFLSELESIGNSFSEVTINLVFWDTEAQASYVLGKSDLKDILNFKAKGGGGTDFRGIYDYLRNENINSKLLLFFTDLYADFPKDEEVKTIWVVDNDTAQAPYGEVLRIGG